METFFQVTAILAAGISLSMGLISLMRFFQKGGGRIDLIFAALCFTVVLFVLLPPIGFLLSDIAPYTTAIKIKRVFNFAFIGLLPWFIALYTGYKKQLVPLLITSVVALSYLFMFFSSNSQSNLWLVSIIIALASVFAFGSFGVFHQMKSGEKIKAVCLFIALISTIFFNIFGAFYRLENDVWSTHWNAVFFPMNICPLAFIIIIGIQLEINSNKQLHLERIMRGMQKRWQAMLDNVPLVVVNTDLQDRVKHINPYGVSLLKYKDESEIIDTLWSDHCISAHNENVPRSEDQGPREMYKNSVLTKDGKGKIINWNSNYIYNEEGVPVGKIRFGTDITGQEEASRQITELKSELEKETLMTNKGPVSSEIGQEILKHEIVGKSRPFIYTVQKSKQVAPTNASVLLLGETGVGKEAFADLIQATSLRSTMPFVKVNCGALPAELIEDELFGHEKGAFTGAIQSRVGRFEKANGGTIFLDEIGELPLLLQPKLLRVLQNGEFERVGGHQTIKVDVRIIAATNSDLDKDVREGKFREDLFYRLNVFPITIPPLRKRSQDIPLLIQHFIEKKSKEYGKHFENISKADMSRLCDYEWPGNIRELKNVIERAVISSPNDTLKLDWFYQNIENNPAPSSNASLEEMETAYILKVLQECNWKINGENGAAEKLVMHPNTLRSRMKKLKINVPWKENAVSR